MALDRRTSKARSAGRAPRWRAVRSPRQAPLAEGRPAMRESADARQKTPPGLSSKPSGKPWGGAWKQGRRDAQRTRTPRLPGRTPQTRDLRAQAATKSSPAPWRPNSAQASGERKRRSAKPRCADKVPAPRPSCGCARQGGTPAKSEAPGTPRQTAKHAPCADGTACV